MRWGDHAKRLVKTDTNEHGLEPLSSSCCSSFATEAPRTKESPWEGDEKILNRLNLNLKFLSSAEIKFSATRQNRGLKERYREIKLHFLETPNCN